MNKSGLNVTSLSLITIGVFMIYCGFTDRNPIEVLKAIMTGDYKNIPKGGTWGHPLVIGGGTFAPLPGSTNPPAQPVPNGNSGPPDVMA